MKKRRMNAVKLMAVLLVSGCASQPEQYQSTRSVEAAVLAEDGHLYLRSLDKTLRFDGAPFQDYRALLDSPLRKAVVCTLMYMRSDLRGDVDPSHVRGSYGMLLDASQVTPDQAQQFGLVRLEVSAKEAANAVLANQGFRKPPSNRYEQGFDRACNLSASGGSYYSALFESDGQWVQLPEYAALFQQSRFPQPIQARMESIRPPRQRSGLGMTGSVLGTAAGIAALPIVLPAFALSIPFLGPEHWK